MKNYNKDNIVLYIERQSKRLGKDQFLLELEKTLDDLKEYPKENSHQISFFTRVKKKLTNFKKQ